ncbi:hypothetical protein ACVNPZ_02580 [Staphylococcus aureus]
MGPLIGGVTASILGLSALLMYVAVITFIVCIFGALKLIETHMQISNTKYYKVISAVHFNVYYDRTNMSIIIVGVLANFAMYGMLIYYHHLLHEYII